MNNNNLPKIKPKIIFDICWNTSNTFVTICVFHRDVITSYQVSSNFGSMFLTICMHYFAISLCLCELYNGYEPSD